MITRRRGLRDRRKSRGVPGAWLLQAPPRDPRGRGPGGGPAGQARRCKQRRRRWSIMGSQLSTVRGVQWAQAGFGGRMGLRGTP